MVNALSEAEYAARLRELGPPRLGYRDDFDPPDYGVQSSAGRVEGVRVYKRRLKKAAVKCQGR